MYKYSILNCSIGKEMTRWQAWSKVQNENIKNLEALK